MIRYELKDKERQAALEKALPGFAKELQQACAQRNGELEVGACVGFEHFQISSPWCKGEWTLALPTADLEVIGKYDLKKWNKYPEVTPPEDISLRCEGHDRDTGRPFRAILRYLDGGFCFDSTDPRLYRSLFPGMVIDRFRPWDEEGEE